MGTSMATDVARETCFYVDCVGLTKPGEMFCSVHRHYAKRRACHGSGACPRCHGESNVEVCTACNFTGRYLSCKDGMRKRP
jgi:hypothetical protein